MRRVTRKIKHTITGTGTGWHVADAQKLLADVTGELLGVTWRLVSGTNTLRSYVFDGQVSAADAATTPQEDTPYDSGLAEAPTASATTAYLNARFEPEAFSDGLTPAVNVTVGAGAFEIEATMHVSLVG